MGRRRSTRPPPRSSASRPSSSRPVCPASGCWAARRHLGNYEEALADLDRGAALARETGRDNVRLQLTVERVAVLIKLGAEATAAAEQGVERARLAGNPPMLLWARCALSSARLAAGDVGAAVQHAEEAAASGVAADFQPPPASPPGRSAPRSPRRGRWSAAWRC